ncbi:MAG TPA: tetraacyldisaccharide 4'-kinase [Ignavibacteria bacterium]|nr:tetraacyldisaccharide 4'-kinase [Ignavibacteria bacterium]
MKLITIPLSFLYRLIVFIRNKLYDDGFIKQKELNCAVISVGNLSAGGTGKTPFVELITDYFLETGKFVVIILKGYKREHDDIKVVELGYDNTSKHQLNTENIGDEAFIYLENLENKNGRCLVVIGDDKLQAAKFATAKFKPEIMIIDDGYQHRKLARNLDILLIDGNEGKLLLPSGKLREPYKNISRADIIILNNKFKSRKIPVKIAMKAGAECCFVLQNFFNYNKQSIDLSGKKAIVFCGVGDPDSFREMLNSNNIEAVKFMEYSDHHRYSISDIKHIISEYNALKADVILTTQKDFVRLNNSEIVLNPESENVYKQLLYNYPLYYAKIKMQIEKNSDYVYSLLEKMSNLL